MSATEPDPVQAPRLATLVRPAVAWLMVLFVLFFVVHVVQVVLAGWSNFRSMITGYDIVEAVESKPDETSAEEVTA